MTDCVYMGKKEVKGSSDKQKIQNMLSGSRCPLIVFCGNVY